MKMSSDKSPVWRHGTAKQINTDAVSSSSSFADSDSTCSMMTPSLEFPDRISFRKMDLSEAGPSGVVVTSNSRNRDITELMPLVRREDKTTVKQIYTDGVSSSSSFADSDSTCSMMTPSLEFPDRISFREMDLSEAGPSGGVITSKSTNRDITKLMLPVQRRFRIDIKVKSGEELAPIDVVAIGGGIEVVRPPVLKPPPSMKRPPIDLQGSSWDFLRLFAPESETVTRPSSSWDEKVGREETGNMYIQLGDTADEAFRGSINTWQKGQLLERGSYATVYEGISEDGEFFAVKEVSLLEQGSQAQECIKQLEREIALLSELQHQNIVRYRGTAKDGSNLYIFLELVSQGSLKKLYQRYQLRNSVASMYTRQILDGLKYLHDKCIIHRDIRCANILVDTNGAVKLADFGLAKVSKLNDIKSCKGTPFWMAPEVINPKGNGGYGSPADIWSLGCTVLEMLTGQIPYGSLEPVRLVWIVESWQ